ncbi:MAG: hypothetical protein ACETVQ_02980 [Candidatus Bathyarchaeia archaeon]
MQIIDSRVSRCIPRLDFELYQRLPVNRLELSVPPREYYRQIHIGKFNVLGQLQVAVYEYEY